MNFFEQQDSARRRTLLLVLLFGAAVVGTVVGVQAAVAGIVYASGHGGDAELAGPIPFIALGIATLGLVVCGSLYKAAQLRRGGRVLAEQLGGRHLHGGNADEDGRRLLNVVEEMALASGVPVPDVYILPDEDGINAFAAGFTTGDAVLGVTQGAVQRLNREQLQGVVAHEFSHILNGDMTLNLRLVGWVHGLLVISLLGQIILRGMRHVRVRGRSKGGGALVAILAVGVALMVLGFVGMFFANLIKAAVSRQREFLADAAAVQFTRNPGGLAGALKVIGALPQRGRLQAPAASVASHMLFAQGARASLTDWLASHPPLEERIRRLEPGWDGRFAPVSARAAAPSAPAAAADDEDELPAGLAALALAGQPRPAHLAWGHELLAGLPAELRADLAEPFGARAAAYALLLAGGQDVQRPGLPVLQERDAAAAERAARLLPRIVALGPRARLPLLDLMLPALRAQSREQFEAFRVNVRALVDADATETLLEWVVQRLLVLQVERHAGRVQPPPVRHATLRHLGAEVGVLLSAVARAAGDEAAADRSFVRAARALGEPEGLRLARPEACGPEALSLALAALAAASPAARGRLLDACAAGITADAEVTVEEAELLRALAISLDIPLPPVLPGQPLRAAAA
jgi:Zn-dependent protease with chaperone function